MTLTATVLRVECRTLLARDDCSGQEILVHSRRACRFRPGERVCIRFSGAMTRSLPPQITAACICRC